jgi:hypothetical protein
MVSFHGTFPVNQSWNNFTRPSTRIQYLQKRISFQSCYKIHTPKIVSLQWTPSWKIHTLFRPSCATKELTAKNVNTQLTKAFLWVPPISSTLSWWDLCSNSFFITIPQTARPYHDGSSVTPVLFITKLKTHHLQIVHIHDIGNNNHPVPLMSEDYYYPLLPPFLFKCRF